MLILARFLIMAFAIGKFAGIDEVIISNTGYTGAGGFEIYVMNGDAKKTWDSIFEAGKEFDIQPVGLAARDTLRLERLSVFTERY